VDGETLRSRPVDAEPDDTGRDATMLFNSYAFWLFFAIVAALYYRLPHRGQNLLLLAASYFFYGCWDWRFLGLIAFSTTVDYFVSHALGREERPARRKLLLATSLTVNLGVLAFFKYYGFFSTEFARLLANVGLPALVPQLDIVLPVGISFYTFQTLSYTVDVYRRDCPPAERWTDFALFVSFFPQLVAGPIERATHLLPQVLRPRVHRAGDFAEGLYFVLVGLFTKVFVADTLAMVTNGVFATPTSQLTGAESLLGVYAFAFQIYGDFAGYSAMARGVAKWLGFDLMENFRRPYFAQSPSEFWQRWHISLSQWLRDYLYIPLGGNRGGSLLTYRNLMLTMLLGGLWHGAAWTFIIWGAFHGAILCLYRFFETRGDRTAKVERSVAAQWARRIVMFHLVCVGWLLFRAESMAQVVEMLRLMVTDFTWTPLASTMLGMILFYAGPLVLLELWQEFAPRQATLLDRPWWVRAAVYAGLVQLMVLFPPPVPSEFIYFQF
jgi:alginate O-acetyltransferase complex protein AlgI